MKTISVMLFGVFVCAAQPGEKLMTGKASSDGVMASFETRREPDSPPIQRLGGGTLTEGKAIKRHICNYDNLTCAGYDLTMAALPNGRVRLRFTKSTLTPRKMSEILKDAPKWRLLRLPGYPGRMDVRLGETVSLDLFASGPTGLKVRDYVTVNAVGRQE